MFVLLLPVLALALASAPEYESVRAIGRSLQIGPLYDVRYIYKLSCNIHFESQICFRSSKELSEDYLWSQQTVEDHVETLHKRSTSYSFISQVRVLDRCMTFDLSSNFASDFMSE